MERRMNAWAPLMALLVGACGTGDPIVLDAHGPVDLHFAQDISWPSDVGGPRDAGTDGPPSMDLPGGDLGPSEDVPVWQGLDRPGEDVPGGQGLDIPGWPREDIPVAPREDIPGWPREDIPGWPREDIPVAPRDMAPPRDFRPPRTDVAEAARDIARQDRPSDPCEPWGRGPEMACSGGCTAATAAPGTTISLAGLDVLAAPEPQVSVTLLGRTLLFSDSPETFATSGVLYRDEAPAGPVRLYMYHVNGYSGAKKVSVVLENRGDQAVGVTVERRAVAGPSRDYLYTGKVCAYRFFEATPGGTFDVPPHGEALLDPDLDGRAVDQDELVNAIWDIQITGRLRVWFVALDSTSNTLGAYAGLAVLSRDGHDRGTFPDADRVARLPVMDTACGTRRVRLGGGTSWLPYVQGVDALTGSDEVLHGDYGIVYRVEVPLASSDGRRMGLLLNPRAGAYGGAVGVPEALYTPDDGTSVSQNTQAVVVLRAAGGQSPAVEWTGPGGSNLPVDLLLVPLP